MWQRLSHRLDRPEPFSLISGLAALPIAQLSAARIVLVYRLRGAPDSQAVAGQLTVYSANGKTWRFPVQGGERLSEDIYAASFDLPDSPVVSRLELEALSPVGEWAVHGLTLLDTAGHAVLHVPRWLDEECHYGLVYTNDKYYLLENRNVLPHAFLVSQVIAARDPADISPALVSPSTDLSWVAQFNRRVMLVGLIGLGLALSVIDWSEAARGWHAPLPCGYAPILRPCAGIESAAVVQAVMRSGVCGAQRQQRQPDRARGHGQRIASTKQMRDAKAFVCTIQEREMRILDRIFTGDSDAFRV